ncbi:hypothetical protein TTRE_0000454401 [Trichuris trichiura]|uniref:Uncharacterized protein n=1 Tax=Trichuris trichiura TaxID=36087 RepID=A0A077Z916_TRITR|nr:hypothetical protein TTRE_0000454401 [Trichuris trichiura]
MNRFSRLSISQSSPKSHNADESTESALSGIEFNMADVALSEYVMRINPYAAAALRWKPRKEFLERMTTFYSSPRRRQLLLLQKELMFKGQLIIAETSPGRTLLRCLVESSPDEQGSVSLVSIDLRKRVHNHNNIYFLIREFANCLPPWVVEVNPISPIVWPDRYSLPIVRRKPLEWEIATEQFRRFRKGPPVPEGGSIGVMIKIAKAVEPHLFLAKPISWLRECLQFREILKLFYDEYKDEFRLNSELLRVGLPVAFNTYGEWHRGEVLSLPGSLGLMKILYLDEGQEDEIRCDMVFHLVKSFTKHEIGLLRIRLAVAQTVQGERVTKSDKGNDAIILDWNAYVTNIEELHTSASISIPGLLPPQRGWPKKAYDYVNEDCVDKEFFFLMTHCTNDVYEGYLAHRDNVKTSLRSMGTQWVGDNLVRNFHAISLAGKPFEESEEDE